MGFGQPNQPPGWVFRIEDVKIQENPGSSPLTPPGNIVNAGNPFQIVTTLHNEGNGGAAMIEGLGGKIHYRLERQEDDLGVQLADTAFIVASNVFTNVYNFVVNSANFSSGLLLSGANLEEGTYVLTVIVSMDNNPERKLVSAMEQTLIRVIA